MWDRKVFSVVLLLAMPSIILWMEKNVGLWLLGGIWGKYSNNSTISFSRERRKDSDSCGCVEVSEGGGREGRREREREREGGGRE